MGTTHTSLSLAALAILPCLTSVPATASADVPDLDLDALMEPPDARPELLALPALGGATPFLALEGFSPATAHGRSFNVAELTMGALGALASVWALADATETGGSLPYGDLVSSQALATNLGMVTRATLRLTIGEPDDPMLRALVPMVTVAPVEGGAVGTLRWRW